MTAKTTIKPQMTTVEATARVFEFMASRDRSIISDQDVSDKDNECETIAKEVQDAYSNSRSKVEKLTWLLVECNRLLSKKRDANLLPHAVARFAVASQNTKNVREVSDEELGKAKDIALEVFHRLPKFVPDAEKKPAAELAKYFETMAAGLEMFYFSREVNPTLVEK
ncbi:MAG: hypothetical protein V2A66_03235 [Pseudomonadota bacterium]